ncbi:MAG: tetratricopeptide repeat protein [Candidatus Eisenbacteria bacterium]|uniref:Tetratricopeptide repeat protein n=1 Tax=Eiseniibacteriota bacterium TaxID=2212470 RepID=A0A7Y2H154_UNCEI|nr:tetratricopeptide repeat protein [Candidatus Eisenbacteria bacterium]
MFNKRLALTLLFCALAQVGLWVWGGLASDNSDLWGLHTWGYLLPVDSLLLALLFGAAFFVIYRGAPFPTRPLGIGGALGLGAVLFYSLRDRAHLLGDGQLWISNYAREGIYHAHEPLAAAASYIAAQGQAGAAGRMEIWGVICGVLGLALLLLITPELARTPRERWIVLMFGLGSATMQFAFGYIEAYPLLWVMTLLFVWSGLLLLRTGGVWWLVGLSFGLAFGTHGIGALLAIPTLLLLFLRRPKLGDLAFALVCFAGPVAFAYWLLPQLLPSASAEQAGAEEVISGAKEIFEGLAVYPFGVGAWVLEQINRWSLLSPFAWLLIPVLFWRFGKLEPGPTGSKTPWFLLVTALALMIPFLVLNTHGSRGASIDWDSFAVGGVVLSLLGGTLIGRVSEQRHIPYGLPAVIAALAVLSSGAFVLIQAKPSSALHRFETLVQSPKWGDQNRSLAYETLYMYHRDAENHVEAAEALYHAAQYSGSARLINNAAVLLSRNNQHEKSAEIYLRLTEKFNVDGQTWYRFGVELRDSGSLDAAKTALRRALQLDTRLVDAMNALGQVILSNPASSKEQKEAYSLFSRSLAIDPDQPYAPVLRRALTNRQDSIEQNQ